MAIITIGGQAGAGKTTLANNLSRVLGFEEFYVGKIFRDLAAERGVTIEQLYEDIEQYRDVEKAIDERQKQFMASHDNTIVQGRIAWFFVKQISHPSINFFLSVSPEVGAKRTQERAENKNQSIEEMITANAHRQQLELERYKKLYQIENFLDPKNYDVIIDTTHLTPDEVLNKALKAIRSSS